VPEHHQEQLFRHVWPPPRAVWPLERQIVPLRELQDVQQVRRDE
jgi:hypothetical protein